MSVATDVTWAICVDYHDGAGVKTGCFSSGIGWRTSPTDTPANKEFQPRILRPPLFSRTIYGDRSTYGRGEVAIGEIALANADGALTDWVGYGFGRRIDIYIGDEGTPFPNAWTLFMSGHVKLAALRGTELVLEIRDVRETLMRPIQTNVYAGDNVLPDGFEGSENDIRGYPKPLCFGKNYNIGPIPVNTAKDIYQVHDGPVKAITSVKDTGAPFTFDADYPTREDLANATVPEGYYATCISDARGSYIKLGSSAGGEVTADVEGDTTGGYGDTVADLVERLLYRVGFTWLDIDLATFAALNVTAPQPVGIFIADEMQVDEVIDQLLASIGAWLLPNRYGVWEIGRREAPSGQPVARITDDDILSGQWILSGDEGQGLPAWRVRLSWGRNWSPMSQVVEVIPKDEQARLKQEWREVVAMDPTVLVRYPDAYSLELETLLVDPDDAVAEATRELSLRNVHRDHLQLDVSIVNETAALDLGLPVLVDSPRFLGSSSPKLMTVTGAGTTGRRGYYQLTLWG